MDLLQAFYRIKVLKVELVIVLFMVGRHLYNPLYEQYYYLIYGSDILKNTSFIFPSNGSSFCISSELIDNYTGSNNSYKLDESLSNHLVMYGQLVNTVPAVITTLMMGPLMDRFGRKIGLIFPVIGTSLQGIFTIFIVRYTLDPYYFIPANFIGGVFGNNTCILAAGFSYIADISSLRWRTLRVGMVESSIAFGSLMGMLGVGYWLRATHCDFQPPLLFYIGCNIFIGLYVFILVPESLTRVERAELRSLNSQRRGPRAYLEGFHLFLGGLSPSATWKLYVSTIAMSVMVLNIHGSSLINVYFLKALPFNFNSLQVGFYEAARSASQGVSCLVVVGFLVLTKMNDVWIMLVAILVHTVCSTLLGFSTKAWELYSIASVKGIEGMNWAGARGLVSKLAKPEQQGALFSIIFSLEAIALVLSGVSWPLIFPLTLKHNMRPGMTFIFMAVLGFCLLPIVLSLFLFKKGDLLRTNEQETSQVRAAGGSSSEGSMDSSDSEEYRPLLTKSWTSNRVFYYS